jgi:hypothetical protein
VVKTCPESRLPTGLTHEHRHTHDAGHEDEHPEVARRRASRPTTDARRCLWDGADAENLTGRGR